MGTALTGSSVASTYDALLKVTDNGPLGGTAKVVTDGLGNDSCFKLGTTSAEFTGALTGTSASFSSTLAAGNTTITGTVTTTSDINIGGTSTQLKFTDTTSEHFVTSNNGQNFLGINQSTGRVRIVAGNSQVATFDVGAVAVTGTVSTTDPAGGAGPAWKLGVAASVSPTSPNRTIRIDIGGTSYYLHAKTTND